MVETENIIYVPAEDMQRCFSDILVRYGFSEITALECARVFTESSIDGIYTHGVNRFPRFIRYIKEGFVKSEAVPTLDKNMSGWEQWNGNLGPGITNALYATERAMKLAVQNGIGCVALRNTNHWMRGGTYAWNAAKAGFIFIGWTNTIANMPAWRAKDARLGNNPIVLAIPFKGEAVVLDMAMSQFSYGALELAAMKNEKLPVYGGFTKEGNPTNDPSEVLASGLPMPAGYWKGAGLSLMLDLLASVLSGGLSTFQLSKNEFEYGLSQVFIAIDISKSGNLNWIYQTIESILQNYHQSVPLTVLDKIVYPGERVLLTRKKNLVDGIPVQKEIWEEIGRL
jgi:3-dehydro-L-gulonate 2-dehydrogenase